MNVPSIISAAAKLALGLWLLATTTAAESFAPIANPDFTQGDDAPAAWQLSGGQGRWVDRAILEVTGSGDDANFWRGDFRFEPGRLYECSALARHLDGSGCVTIGPPFANRDFRLSREWHNHGFAFRVPDNAQESYIRLGQWHATGNVQFHGIILTPSIPVHTLIGGLLLGEGESIRDGRYTFSGTFSHQGANYHRPLHAATAGFNSDRWVFSDGAQVVYRFELPGHAFRSGKIGFNVNYYVRGGCTAEVSRDGRSWHQVAVQEKLGEREAEVPETLLPAEVLFLKLATLPGPSSFQVNRVEFSSELDGAPADATGKTFFTGYWPFCRSLTIEEIALLDSAPSREPVLRATIRNTSQEAVLGMLDTAVSPPGDERFHLPAYRFELGAGASETLRVCVPVTGPGHYVVDLDLCDRKTTACAYVHLEIPDYYRADYGRRIEGAGGKAAVWWSDATHKIPRQRPLPQESSAAAELTAARNDREAVQIVVRSDEHLRGLTAVARPLVGSDGATIAAENVKISRVAYHSVDHPTDKTGVRDWWPDALPPLDEPIDVPAGENQPLWVLVHVPEDAKAGDYTGVVSLRAEGFSADVPIKLHVWDFTLPERNHLETAFGLSAGNVYRYHGLKAEEDKRRVLDMYFRNFAEHRISPYDPTPLDPIRVRFRSDTDPPRAELDFSAFDPAMTRAVETFRFTGFRLPIQGMGGGTFHSRVDPKIGNFTQETPEYQAMFSSYVGQLEEHFRRKGWLDEAYIYWFDEPAPKDYEFVANGMKRLKKYSPGLRRMLTEEPGENPLAGTIDIWCPVSFNYNHEEAEKRRARGERFWWYVCCGPKAPYCTLFIDHPATELRVWLWQTWQRKIDGILVWSSNYWTSSAAFPDPKRPQNPYEDPMGYVSGYSTPEGTKRYWGNGDGRFIYPAESAAVPGLSGEQPVIEPPVSSIRWEMLREGIEDYEFLYMLRELIEKRRNDLPPGEIEKYEALLEVPESITRDMTTFTTDPTPIYARRAEIAEAIERLGP